MLEMLLCPWRQEEIQHEGHVQAAQRGHVGPLQTGVARQLRLGGKPRLPHGEWADDDVQTGEAGAQCLLRQTLGLPRWCPHRADRVFTWVGAEYWAAQPAALHEQSRVWARQTNNRRPAHLAWSYFQRLGRLSKTRSGLLLF